MPGESTSFYSEEENVTAVFNEYSPTIFVESPFNQRISFIATYKVPQWLIYTTLTIVYVIMAWYMIFHSGERWFFQYDQ